MAVNKIVAENGGGLNEGDWGGGFLVGNHKLFLARQFIKHLSHPQRHDAWNEKRNVSWRRSRGHLVIEVW